MEKIPITKIEPNNIKIESIKQEEIKDANSINEKNSKVVNQ